MSGEALAKEVGYKNQSAIGNLENRPGGTGGNKISEIAHALAVPLDWLLRGPDGDHVPDLPKTVNSPQAYMPHQVRQDSPDYFTPTHEVTTIFNRLTEAGKQQALVYLRFLDQQERRPTQSVSGESNPLSHPKAA